MAGTAKKVWRFIESLGTGVAFSTRQLLGSGKRNTIDKTLSRLVQKGLITRLADGVFILPDNTAPQPNQFDIVQVKARAFNKQISQAKHNTNIFNTDGCKSSFRSIHGRLHFRQVSPRKLLALKQANQSKAKNPTLNSQTSSAGIPNNEFTDLGPVPSQEKLVPIGLIASFVPLINKMKELFAVAESRLRIHSIRKADLKLSFLALQFF